MRSRVVQGERAVAGAGQHLAFRVYHHGADRDLAEVARPFPPRRAPAPSVATALPLTVVICKLRRHGRQSGGQAEPGQAPREAVAKDLAAKPAEPMRIAKAIAHAGLCSRRDAEAWIVAGRVAVNGKVLATPAYVVSPERQRHGGRQASARGARRAAVALSQAAGPGHQPQGPARAENGVRGAASRPAARGLGGTARYQHRRPAPAHHRRRAGAASRIAEHRLAQALSRACSRARRRRRRSTVCAKASPSTASSTGRSRRASTASRVPISGSPSPCAKARTARSSGIAEHLGLTVNRLIRVSFGPFALGDLAEGAAEEVKRRVIAEQLGAKLAAQFGLIAPAKLRRQAPPQMRRCES